MVTAIIDGNGERNIATFTIDSDNKITALAGLPSHWVGLASALMVKLFGLPCSGIPLAHWEPLVTSSTVAR